MSYYSLYQQDAIDALNKARDKDRDADGNDPHYWLKRAEVLALLALGAAIKEKRT